MDWPLLKEAHISKQMMKSRCKVWEVVRKRDVRCHWRAGEPTWTSTIWFELHFLKKHSCLKGLGLLFVTVFCPATQKVFFISSSCTLSFSLKQGGAHNVPLLRLLKSPALHSLFILTKSLIFPASSSATLFWLGQSLSTSFLMFMLIFKSLSLSLFWHLLAVKDRQIQHKHWQLVQWHKTGFDGMSCRLQNIQRTLYIKAIWSWGGSGDVDRK